MTRRATRALRLLLAVLAAPLAACGRDDAPEVPPVRRVIWISCDTLRADRLSAYGCERPTSPEVDAFAREATLYENAWSCCSITGPAVSTMLTGLLPDELGLAAGNRMMMASSVETLPEILQAKGIATAAVVSNWVLRRPPAELGDVGVAQGFDHFDDTMEDAEANRDFRERRAEATTDAAIAWLDGRKPDERFFLWVHYQDPHGPYEPPPELAQEFLAGLPEEVQMLGVSKNNRGLGALPAYQVLGNERRPGRYRALYDAEIRAFDRGFGRLVAHLRSRGFLDDALVVFTADHGESLGERQRWFCHAENLHVEETRVPLVVRFPDSRPGGARRGERTEELASHLDLLPTTLQAFGIEPRPALGSSLFAAQLPEDRVVPQTLHAVDSVRRWEALTTRRHRVVFNRRFGPRLFDIEADPLETTDVAANHPDVVARIEQSARAMLQGRPVAAPAVQDTGEDAARAMRAMGYAGEEGDGPR